MTALDGPVLAIDTSGTLALVALGARDGSLIAESRWVAGYRHGEELLARVDSLLREAGVDLQEIGAVACGTGPGAFTGLRVGLATAKGLASGLRVPIVGIPTSAVLLDAAAERLGCEPATLSLLLPAGPSDRVFVAGGEARLVRGGEDPELDGRVVVAVDLPGRAPDEALAIGAAAEEGLGRSLVRLAAERLRETDGDDLARLVPEYVTLPRGVPAVVGEVKWSRDRS